MPERLRFPTFDAATLDRVIETLEPFVSVERRARIEAATRMRTRDVVVVLEDIYDEHNASAVLRTADAFGVHEVHIVEQKTRFSVHTKTSLGAHKWLDLGRHRGTDAVYGELAARGYAVWASALRGEPVELGDIDVSKQKIALVFGNEHEGLSKGAQDAAHGCFRIPMYGFVESLNVSVATAVSMHDVLRRKKELGVWSPLAPLEQKRLRAEWLALSVRAARMLLTRVGITSGVERAPPIRYATGGEPPHGHEDAEDALTAEG
ncbi:RNA methyltransferase [Myxococcota bacterium]|nr:RNA methyltransferase [Myxococcota bacterium]